MGWWWLSFADTSRATREEAFIACLILEAQTVGEAIARAQERGLHPGGEVRGVELPPAVQVPARYRDRLLSIDDADEARKDLENQVMAAMRREVREGTGAIPREVKEAIYGVERFEAVGKQSEQLLYQLSEIVQGADVAAVVNATMVTMISAMRADGCTLERARQYLGEAWDSPGVSAMQIELYAPGQEGASA